MLPMLGVDLKTATTGLTRRSDLVKFNLETTRTALYNRFSKSN